MSCRRSAQKPQACRQGDTERWDICNLTVDGRPIPLHLVRYQVVNRRLSDPLTVLPIGLPRPPGAEVRPDPLESGVRDGCSGTSPGGEARRVQQLLVGLKQKLAADGRAQKPWAVEGYRGGFAVPSNLLSAPSTPF
ncbi:MAG: hypothetical protein P1P84_18580 [Deferrisomatales bacterium]|nr:hypothetical protein [Deferrisomatales bacterium]